MFNVESKRPASPTTRMRRFPGNDVVILDGPRCDGRNHDGCKHGCRIFWKEAWLRPLVDADEHDDTTSEAGLEALRARLKVKSDEQHYFCQSTELYRATEAFTGKQKLWTTRIVLQELRTGEMSVARAREVVRVVVLDENEARAARPSVASRASQANAH